MKVRNGAVSASITIEGGERDDMGIIGFGLDFTRSMVTVDQEFYAVF